MSSPAVHVVPKVATDAMEGRFPLISDSTKKQWELLISELENNMSAFLGSNITFGGDKVPGQAPHVKIYTEKNSVKTLLGEMYLRIWTKYVEANFSAAASFMPGWLERIRDLLVKEGVDESHVALSVDPNIAMSDGLNCTTLTLIPDSNIGVRFGSVPDQTIIGVGAPAWNKYKRRRYETKTGAYMAKNHYVLAHMLNHNLNGSGKDPHNVTPFWAAANTDMAKKAEKQMKELVWRCFTTRYTITFGPPVGFANRRPVLEQILAKNGITFAPTISGGDLVKLGDKLTGNAKLQFEIVELEQHLTTSLIIVGDCSTPTGWVNVVNVTIDNFVPATIPDIL